MEELARATTTDDETRDEGVRRQLRRILDLVSLFGMTPVVIVVVTMSLREGRPSLALALFALCQTLSFVVSLAGLGGRLPCRGRFYTLLLLVQTLLAVLHFGPLLGMGIMLMGTVICATVFFDRRRDVFSVVGLALTGVVLAGAYAITTRPARLDDVDMLSWPLWFRTIATATVGAVAVAWLLSYLLRSLEEARQRAILALEREREGHRVRERLQGQLELSRRLEDIGRLAGGVAHDVNNAFAVVLSNAELLDERLRGDREARELVGEVRQASLAAKQIVGELMLLGHPATQSAADCEPAAVVAAMAPTLRRLLPERIDLEVECDPRARALLTLGQLQRIVMNLVLNARDAIETNGRVRITVTLLGDEVVVAVRDDGVGMPRDTIERMFDPFFTTKGVGKGNGLGLSTVQALVQNAGGRVEVTSRARGGTTVSVLLPAQPARRSSEDATVEGAALASVAPPAPTSTPPSGPLAILLVEDDSAVRRSTSRLLSVEGHHVVEAANEAEAVARMDGASFDLLLTDVVMPDSNAARLIDTFLSRFPARPIIVCSGWVQEELVRQGIDAGAYAFLQKPFERDTLIATVEAARGLAPGVARQAS